MIQLQRLEGFYWVAKTQGFAKAARAFPYPITQPGVHQQVRRLEAELGVRLLERVAKDVVALTAAGRALFDAVAPFYEGLGPLERSLRAGTHGGRLTVFAAGLHLRHLLPPGVRRLQARRPDIEVVLKEIHTPDLTVLRDGQADLLIDHLFSVPADIEVRAIGEMHTFVVVPSNHPLARRASVRVVDLGRETFIAYNQGLSGRELQLRALELHGVVPPRLYGADSAETILGFVAAGIGVSLVPALSEHGVRTRGVVAHQLTMPGASFAVHAAWKKSPSPNPLREAALAAFSPARAK